MNATTTTLPSKSDSEISSPNWFSSVKPGASGGSLYSVPRISRSSEPEHPASRKHNTRSTALDESPISPLP